jgi:hypothetical protein
LRESVAIFLSDDEELLVHQPGTRSLLQALRKRDLRRRS